MLRRARRVSRATMDQEARVTELEIQLAHQQHLLSELNDALVHQQQELDRVSTELSRLQELVSAMLQLDPSDDTKPPHY